MSRLDKKQNIQKSCRQFLIGTAGSGLMMAFAPVMAAVDSLSDSASARLGARQFEPTIWFNINESGQILINITKAEMGQHVGTALARIVADELGANWADVAIRYVDSGTCHASNSEVVCPDKAISFAEIVKTGQIDRVFTAEELARFEPKKPSDRKLIAKNTQTLDIPAKTDEPGETAKVSELDILNEGARLARDKSTGGQFVEEGNIDSAALEAGKPVKLIFTREDDSRFDCIRSASVQHFNAYWDKADHLTGIDQVAVAGWPTLAMAPGFMPDSIDKKPLCLAGYAQ